MNIKIRVTHDENRTVSEVPHNIIHYPAGEVGFTWGGLDDYISDWGIEIDIDVDIYNANDLMVLHRIMGEIRQTTLHYRDMFRGKFDQLYYKDLVKFNSLNIGYMGFARQDKSKVLENGQYETEMYKSALSIISDHMGGTNCKVTILDPHSKPLLKNGEEWKLGYEYKMPDILFPDVEPIFPDEGALRRYVGSVYPPKPYLFAKKERGDDGSIISYDIVEGDIKFDPNKDYVVFDDICDGGATFLFLAKLLTEKGHKGKLYLQVTHGLFTKGKEELLKYYDEIRTMTEMK